LQIAEAYSDKVINTCRPILDTIVP
jgi:hypothetical protein